MSSDGNLRASLEDVVVVEIGDQMGDYAAMLMAGLGAEVLKIEPPEGSPSRTIGPFASAAQDPERSIFFWRYNLNKKSAVLDIDAAASEAPLSALASKADVVLLSGEYETVERRLGLWRKLAEANPRLIVCTITPFGLDGPYRALKATDGHCEHTARLLGISRYTVYRMIARHRLGSLRDYHRWSQNSRTN